MANNDHLDLRQKKSWADLMILANHNIRFE